MRAVMLGGFRPYADFSVACRAAKKALLRTAKKVATRGPDPFVTFLDTFDRFVKADTDSLTGDRC